MYYRPLHGAVAPAVEGPAPPAPCVPHPGLLYHSTNSSHCPGRWGPPGTLKGGICAGPGSCWGPGGRRRHRVPSTAQPDPAWSPRGAQACAGGRRPPPGVGPDWGLPRSLAQPEEAPPSAESLPLTFPRLKPAFVLTLENQPISKRSLRSRGLPELASAPPSNGDFQEGQKLKKGGAGSHPTHWAPPPEVQ